MKFPLNSYETKRALLEGAIVAILGLVIAWPLGFGLNGYFVVILVGFVITTVLFLRRMGSVR